MAAPSCVLVAADTSFHTRRLTPLNASTSACFTEQTSRAKQQSRLHSSHHPQRQAVQRLALLRSARQEEVSEAADSGLATSNPAGFKPPKLMATVEELQNLAAVQRIELEEEVEERVEYVAAFVGAAVLFGAGVWGLMGAEKGAEYFAGYLLEQSLSVDNLFVFVLVFKFFRVPPFEQEKVLAYGIATAAVLRAVMILLGTELIHSFAPVFLLFGAILCYSSFKLLLLDNGDDDEDLSDNFIVKACKQVIPVADDYEKGRFFTVQDGVRMATPLLLVLAVVERSDVVFAVDSIPAVFGVTTDPFIVYTSNIFAILSLRALYGAVASIMRELRYLDKAVGTVLGFIGFKMWADFFGFHLGTQQSLAFVAMALTTGVAASLLLPADPAADS